jgi:hypothetical protein
MTSKYLCRHYTCKTEPRQFDQACDKPVCIGRTACLSPSPTSFSQPVTQSSSLNHIYHLFRIHLHYSLLHVLAITSQMQDKTKFWIATVTDPPLCMWATASRLSISRHFYFHELCWLTEWHDDISVTCRYLPSFDSHQLLPSVKFSYSECQEQSSVHTMLETIQDRQCTYNAIFKRALSTIVVVEKRLVLRTYCESV